MRSVWHILVTQRLQQYRKEGRIPLLGTHELFPCLAEQSLSIIIKHKGSVIVYTVVKSLERRVKKSLMTFVVRASLAVSTSVNDCLNASGVANFVNKAVTLVYVHRQVCYVQ